MSIEKNNLYVYEEELNLGTQEQARSDYQITKYPDNDLRVFVSDYCDINYVDGYLFPKLKTYKKGKVKHYISNGIGDWRDKIKTIKQNLGDYDVAYFVIPEIQAVAFITKYQDMPVFASTQLLNNMKDIANSVAYQVSLTKVNELIDNKMKNISVNISFVATDKNKVYEMKEISLDDGWGYYKIPDELKCGDYEVEVTTKNYVPMVIEG